MPETPARQGPSLAKLRRLANAQKFDELELAWMETLAEAAVEVADLVPVAGQVGRLGEAARADAMIGVLIGSLTERSGVAVALAAARQAAAELPASPLLRSELPRLYVAARRDDAEAAALIGGIFTTDGSLAEAVALADVCLHMRPGAFVKDPRQYDPGLVETVDRETGEVVVRFGIRRQTFSRADVMRLIPLPDEHFRGLMLYRPERLRELATHDPVEFVHRAVEAAKDNALAYRDLKTHATTLLGEKGWTSWWASTRLAIKRDPLLEASGGSQPVFRLLAAERPREERLRAEFTALGTPEERLRLILGYLDEATTAHPADPGLLSWFGQAVARQAMALLPADPMLALACLAVHAELATRGADVPRPGANAAAQVLGRVEDPAQLARRLDERLLRAVLEYLRVALPDRWAGLWAKVLPRAGKRLGESLARELIDRGHAAELETALREVIDHPTAAPDMVIWLWRARRASRLGPLIAGMATLPELDVFLALLQLADATGRLCGVSDEERHHKVLAQVQQALSGASGLPARDLLAALDADAARRLKVQLAENGGLSVSGRRELYSYLRAAHADVFAESERPWAEDAIYTTPAGLERRQQEFDDLVKVDLPEVARQIGEAAAHGDLSENAEYKAALEKRDLITSRASHIEAELARARLIPAELTTSPFVNIGTCVRAHEEGQAQDTTFTFLGPWDSDPDNQVLDYSAPLALAFMGRRPGETVTFGEPPESRRFTVLAVEPAW